MHERGPQPVPEWAKRERTSDLAWIHENWHIFFPAARAGFEQAGRGAIVTDTTVAPVEHEKGKGHPFGYLPLSLIEGHKEESVWGDVVRMVRGYDPTWELVCVLLKQSRESAYRVGAPSQRPTASR